MQCETKEEENPSITEEIQRALDAATPGPWMRKENEVWTAKTDKDDYHTLIAKKPRHIGFEHDLHLIANAPIYLRYLLDERDKDKKQIEYLQSVVKADETTLERITKERDDFMNELKNVANPAWNVAVENIKLRKEAELLRSELAGFHQR